MTTSVRGARGMWIMDEGLQCDACQRWFLVQCEQVSQKEYKRISDMRTSVMWLCQQCKINFQVMAGKNRKLKDESKKLKDENKELRRMPEWTALKKK